jgi:hypothetical protein
MIVVVAYGMMRIETEHVKERQLRWKDCRVPPFCSSRKCATNVVKLHRGTGDRRRHKRRESGEAAAPGSQDKAGKRRNISKDIIQGQCRGVTGVGSLIHFHAVCRL